MNYRRILARNAQALKDADETLNSNAKIAARCSTPTRKVAATAIGYMLDGASGINPKLDTIVAFAEAFKVRPGDLLDPSFDPRTRATAPGCDLPPDVVALAHRIAALPPEKRELLMDIFGDAVPDGDLEANGWKAPVGEKHAVHEKQAPYRREPRQFRIKLKR